MKSKEIISQVAQRHALDLRWVPDAEEPGDVAGPVTEAQARVVCTDLEAAGLEASWAKGEDGDYWIYARARAETKPSRLMIRTLSRCPGSPSEWQWTEAVDADAPDGASVEDYVSTNNDSSFETHVGVYLVSAMSDSEREEIGLEDIRGRIHRQVGSLVAWVLRDGTVAYELVSEE